MLNYFIIRGINRINTSISPPDSCIGRTGQWGHSACRNFTGGELRSREDYSSFYSLEGAASFNRAASEGGDY